VHNPLYGVWKKIYKKVLNVKHAECLNGPRDIGANRGVMIAKPSRSCDLILVVQAQRLASGFGFY
jgi:hypothetical protein